MKKDIKWLIAVIVGIIIAIIVTQSYAADDPKKAVVQQCPKTLMTESCFECHTKPTFALKEAFPTDILRYPNGHTSIKNGIGYYYLQNMISEPFVEATYYFKFKGVKHIIIEIFSPGGSMFEAWRIKGYMDQLQSQGIIMETRLYGFGASAGFLVFVAGQKDHRFISPTAEAMWHELQSFKLFDISSPADKEDEARVLRHLQDTANEWIASRSKLSKKELDEKIRKKELWCNGKEAVEIGFADGFIK